MNTENLTFLDILTIMGFVISLQNLELNISQDDLQKEADRLDKVLRDDVDEIHRHLEAQDEKIERILEKLK